MQSRHWAVFLLTAAVLSPVAQAPAAPDPARCADLKAKLEAAQAEYKSDMDNMPSTNADQAETKQATLARDKRVIDAIEVQISAEGCEGAKPLPESPAALGPGGTTDTTSTGTTGTTTGTTPVVNPDAPYAGDYNTFSELGTLHLETVANPLDVGFKMPTSNTQGPPVPCVGYDTGQTKVYRGYFKPDASYQEVTDYGSCDGICVFACTQADGTLHAKFSDRSGGGASKASVMRIGTFVLIMHPNDKFLTGGYKITGNVQPTDGAPETAWRIEKVK